MDKELKKFLHKEKDARFVKYLEVLLEKGYFKGLRDNNDMNARLEKAKTKFYSNYSVPAPPQNRVAKTKDSISKNFLGEYEAMWKEVVVGGVGSMVAGHVIGYVWKRSKL
jgi:hypothetical protein